MIGLLYNDYMNNNPTITVIGGGYVGLTTAVLFSHSGHKVYLIETDKERLDVIKSGRSFFFETGLDSLIKTSIEKHGLIPTDSYSIGIPKSEIVFSCVGTPDNPDGSFDMSYVFDSVKKSAKYLKPNAIFVQKSTVPVGTGILIEKILSRNNKGVAYVSNPEFLREGHSISDSLAPDRVVVGGRSVKAVNKVIGLYKTLEKNRASIAKTADIKIKPNKIPYIKTNTNSAELIKISSNAFLAIKISFANSIAKLADRVDADVNEIMDAVGADKRIGHSFLNAGRGFGGGCLPKDISGLIASGIENGVDLDIIKAAKDVNDSMPGYIIEKLRSSIGGSLKNKRVAVLGLSFKANINDTRKSPGIAMANLLDKAEAIISVYDPQVDRESAEDLNTDIIWQYSAIDAIKNNEAVIIATDWKEFLELSPKRYAENMTGKKIFVDATNRFQKSKMSSAGLSYIGVGR